jgi:hypothetical protein
VPVKSKVKISQNVPGHYLRKYGRCDANVSMYQNM